MGEKERAWKGDVESLQEGLLTHVLDTGERKVHGLLRYSTSSNNVPSLFLPQVYPITQLLVQLQVLEIFQLYILMMMWITMTTMCCFQVTHLLAPLISA